MDTRPIVGSHYQLNENLRLSQITGEDCSLYLKDNSDNILGEINVCGGIISKVGGYNGEHLSSENRKELIHFIKENKLVLNAEGAKGLGLSVFKPAGGFEQYLSASEMEKKLKGNISGAEVSFNKYKKNTLRIRSGTVGAILNLAKAAVKKLIIEKDCNLVIDLSHNPYIEKLIIKDSFAGRLNMSHNSIRKIDISNNCRCDMNIFHSLKCMDLQIADVFSGSLNMEDSCFNHLDVGYYSYAAIKLKSNWGKKDIKIGNSFRGRLEVDNVHVPHIRIGDDCKGKIVVKSDDDIHGSKFLHIEDGFNGEIDFSGSKTISDVEFGHGVKGQIKAPLCQSLRLVRFGDDFNAMANFTGSQLEYLETGKDCRGSLILFHCDNLALLKMPGDHAAAVKIERQPIRVENAKNNVCYHFCERNLPPHYFHPLYKDWCKNIKHFFKEQLRA